MAILANSICSADAFLFRLQLKKKVKYKERKNTESMSPEKPSVICCSAN